MNLIDRTHLWERKLESWIGKHKIKWVLSLFAVGLIVGLGSNALLGGTLRQGLTMSLAYSCLLVICDYSIWGTE